MLTWTIKNINWKKTAILTVGLFVAVFVFFSSVPTLAQADVPGADPTVNDAFGLQPLEENLMLPSTDIRLIVARIIRAVLGLLGIIVLILVLYAGFLIMTAGGNEEKVAQGKKTLINATIGLAIILSSFAIAQFIINMLSGGFQQGAPSDFVKKPYINTYSGSGALGKIIKDHYPARDQIGVKRNVSIIVTFAESINPSSLIENTNNTCYGPGGTIVACGGENTVEYFGDCVPMPDGFTENYYAKLCDQLKTTSAEIYQSGDENKSLVAAAALASYDANGDAYTFVFKPLEPIGSDTEDVWYTVDLRPSILKKVQQDAKDVSVFSGSFSGHYLWEFQTDTNFDFDPPHVEDINPNAGELNVPRNRVLQITFNEAMNPLVVQGEFSVGSFFDNIVVNRPKEKSEDSIVVSGEWKITNGYKTVEFIPSKECGFNSCGELMYCLNVDCPLDEPKCSNDYETLIRTALKMPNGIGFASFPLSGVMDTADNALNGNWGSEEEGGIEVFNDRPNKGVDGNYKLIGEQEKVADNYFWEYSVINKIDREAPFVEKVEPNLDQGGVGEKTPIKIYFSKRMMFSSLDNLSLVEHPEDSLDAAGNPIEFKDRNFYPIGSCFLVGDDLLADKRCLDTLWYLDSSKTVETENSPDKTLTQLLHRDLGPNGYDFYYFPIIPSTIRDQNQNCLYPGYGPDTTEAGMTPVCKVIYDEDGKITALSNCVPVKFVSSTDTGCIQTTEAPSEKLQPDTNTCSNFLKEKSI